jgi:hypothetical protein
VVVLTGEELKKAKEELKRRMKSKESEMLDRYKETLQDSVKLHEEGWKER